MASAILPDKTIKKTFPVTGLSCASCAFNVEQLLKKQKGIVNAVVNYANSTAIAEYNPGITAPATLKQAVQSIGYDLITDNSDKATKELEKTEERDYKRQKLNSILAITLAIPVVFISMFFMDMPYGNYITGLLTTVILLFFGNRFFISAWKQATHRAVNMDTLIAISTGTAYLFSIFNIAYPQFWYRQGLQANIYFEAVAIVISFLLLGKLLEEKAKSNTATAIKKLICLQPKIVTVIKQGSNYEIPIEQVQTGDLIQVKPGEKIPVDGMVAEGSSYIDESMLTGEPVAVLKESGAKVFTGTINQKGSLIFKADKVGNDTLLAHIIKRVQEAQGSKAPVQKLVDKVAGIFVPVVISIAILSFGLWILLGGHAAISHGLLAFITVLVIACPCALGLATPTAIMAGIGKGAEHGILIKDAESLQLAHKINVIVLDKTGTITEGRPIVADIKWQQDIDIAQLSSVLASIEAKSEHPLAAAIVNYFANYAPVSLSSFESIISKGVTAVYNSEKYFIGNKAFIDANSIKTDKDILQQAEEWSANAYTVIWFAEEHNALAVIAITDKIKPSSAQAVSKLQQMGIEVYMLTGDNEKTAQAIAKQACIPHYMAGTLPDDKADFIKQLQQQGKVVAMVGDGINDSQALAQADVSIAMGQGSDIAMEVASITLMSSNLLQIPFAINLSRKTTQLIRQNLFWAFIYNIIGIPLAAGILYPVNGFMLNPMIAGGAMALSSLSVVCNSLRLKWSKI